MLQSLLKLALSEKDTMIWTTLVAAVAVEAEDPAASATAA